MTIRLSSARLGVFNTTEPTRGTQREKQKKAFHPEKPFQKTVALRNVLFHLIQNSMPCL